MNQTLIRSVLKIGAGYFVAKGFADESTSEVIVAGLAALIGVIWGLVHRSDGKIANPLTVFAVLCVLCASALSLTAAEAPKGQAGSTVLPLPQIAGAPAQPASTTVPPSALTAKDTIQPELDAYAAGRVTVSPFASYRAHELGAFNGKFGGGLAVEYAPVNNIGIELSTLSEGVDYSPLIDSLKEVGINFKGYLPIGRNGFAPYGFIGYTRELHESDEANRMNAGAGVAWRYKRVSAFADGQWTHNFRTLGHALFRVGGGLSF